MDTNTTEREIASFAAQLTTLLAGTGREGTSEEMRDLARSCIAPTDAERLAYYHERAEYAAEMATLN
jgi:hypothetical protein